MKKYLILLIAFSYCSVLEPDSQGTLKSILSSTIWQNIGNPGFSDGESPFLSMAIDDEKTPYISFKDVVHDYKVSVMKYNGTHWQYVGPPGFGGIGGAVLYQTSLVVYKGIPYVSYRDQGFGNRNVVMVYNETINTWIDIGKGINEGGWQSLAINNQGVLYIAFNDLANKCKATVMKYNGEFWEYIGKPSFSSDSVNNISLKIAPNDTPYIAFQDKDSKASVMKYNKISQEWEYVGTPGFSSGKAAYTSLVIDKKETPYVAFRDDYYGGRTTVMTYNGKFWKYLGKPGFSAGDTVSHSLAIDNKGTLYIAYQDNGNSGKATVMIYDIGKNKWIPAGTPGFSVGPIRFPSLVISPYGTPYIGYQDGTQNYKATVMKMTVQP